MDVTCVSIIRVYSKFLDRISNVEGVKSIADDGGSSIEF